MTLYRRDFIELANIIKRQRDEIVERDGTTKYSELSTLQVAINNMCILFKKHNKLFNEEKFIMACGFVE